MASHISERVTLARLPSGVEIATTVHIYEDAADERETLSMSLDRQHKRDPFWGK